MADLHFIGGEKGGVGKSLVARTLTQYFIDQDIPFVLFDTDRSNPDLARIYGKAVPCRLAVFSEGEKYEDTANQVFNTATSKRVLVNLPAQVFPAMRKWFEDNDLLDIAEEEGVTPVMWFVSDGGYDSLNLMRKSMDYFQGRVQHVIVRNWGRNEFEDWDEVLAGAENIKLKQLLTKYQPAIIDFPKWIGMTDRNQVDARSLTFGQAREDKQLSAISRQRVKKFLRQAYEAFGSTAIFNDLPSSESA
ncbi:MAG: hypothetical protein AAGG53_02410 [Cyanobacteria bacterium P01_H01_bin.152]